MSDPIDFPAANMTLTAPVGDPSVKLLRVWTDGELCISGWELSWRERLSALVFGRVWIFLKSGRTQPPIAIEASRYPFTEEQP